MNKIKNDNSTFCCLSSTKDKMRGNNRRSPLEKILLQKIFPFPLIESNIGGLTITRTSEGSGTGVFISADGLILTAAHLVEDVVKSCENAEKVVTIKAKEGKIKKKDVPKYIKQTKKVLDLFGSGVGITNIHSKQNVYYLAQILSYDETADIALLKVKSTKKLNHLNINTCYEPLPGETVFGLVLTPIGEKENAIWKTTAFISKVVAIDKYRINNRIITEYQIDYGIERGNSGGVVLNQSGEVIGVLVRENKKSIGIGEKETNLEIDGNRGIFVSLTSTQIDFKKYLS